MPIDYTIPLKAGTGAQTNPLQSALQAAQFRMASLNSQALQQGIDANNAASQAFKESTDANGNTDYNKFRSIMASGAGAYNLPQINNSILDAQQKQQTLSSDQFNLAKAQNSFLYQRLGAIDPSSPDFQKQVFNTANEFIHNYQGDPQKVIGQLSDLPAPDATPQQK